MSTKKLTLRNYALAGDNGASTVVIEILDNIGLVVYKGSINVTTTPKSFDVFLNTGATPAATYTTGMRSVIIYSVSGAPLLINTGGSGNSGVNNGVTSGFEPVTGQSYRVPIGTYTAEKIGFGEMF
jgi:hypothetical protein